MSILSYLVPFYFSLVIVSGAVINQCNRSGSFALCIDGGPGSHTGQVLSHLKQKKARATFHITTKYLSDPSIQSLVQQIAADGHLIGLSLENVSNLTSMSEDQIKNLVARQGNVLASFINYYPKFVRLPYQGTLHHN